MGSLKTVYTSVETFAADCKSGYSEILSTADETLAKADNLLMKVNEDYDNVNLQISQIDGIIERASRKKTDYEIEMDEILGAVSQREQEINYCYENPEEEEYTDSEGNTVVEQVVDYDTINALEREIDSLMVEYYYYKDLYEQAESIHLDAKDRKEEFEGMANAISKVIGYIETDISDIKRYIFSMEDEAENNLGALSGLLNSIELYLHSPSFIYPTEPKQLDFSSPSSQI